MTLLAGQNFAIQLNGETWLKPPEGWDEPAPNRAETVERMGDSFPLIELADPWDGCPDVVQKYTWNLAFPPTGDPDLIRFLRLAALPGLCDFCPWQTMIETFTCDGVRQRFRMQRRDASVFNFVIPPLADTDNPTILRLQGGADIEPTFDVTPDENGCVGFGVPDVYGAGTVLELQYPALFRVRPSGMSKKMVRGGYEVRSLILEEA
jgi:hypothetical protein